ncbi:MAG: TlyA family RNA methyltransferase [Desulfobacterales bacterium]|nr:TlyA family RNA methyltransferase [Desulfobacterales bacterium]
MAARKGQIKKPGKQRLDQLLVETGRVASRQRAKTLIMAGKVLVNDVPVDKAGTLVKLDAAIIVKQDENPYVSRGGLKLEKALAVFPVTAEGQVCLDIGASTGGFTDCLLQNNAKKVFAVDVGYGQLAWSLRQDSRVVVIERTNIRHLEYETVGEAVDMVVADTSFISLRTVIPAAEKFMRDGTKILALIKPQFEAGREHIGKGGVVKDPEIRKKVVDEITAFFRDRGYQVHDVVPSPILGPKGNEEFLIHMDFRTLNSTDE